MKTTPLQKAPNAPVSQESLERTRAGRVVTPAVDIYEDADGLTLVADMPGAVIDTIDVHFEHGELTLDAKRDPGASRSGADLLVELEPAGYFRRFRVSEEVDASRISANYERGILTLHLPKVEAAKPRKIAVQAKA